MSADPTRAPIWSTASFGDDGSTRPIELQALGEHLQHCDHLKGRWFSVHCAMQATVRYGAGHVITSLIMLIALALAISMAL